MYAELNPGFRGGRVLIFNYSHQKIGDHTQFILPHPPEDYSGLGLEQQDFVLGQEQLGGELEAVSELE